MFEIKINQMDKISKGFIKEDKIPAGEHPYFYRNCNIAKVNYRNLFASEIETLVKNNNFAEDWNEIFVSEKFNPSLVINNEFFGRIYIGNLIENYLEYNDLRLPVGIYNSSIYSSEIGDNVSIRNVNYLSHYIISKNCILFNINEMITSDRSKFGNGVLKEDEDEDIRVWIEVSNENGGRKILPFETMIPSDAYIWSKYRDDKVLMERLKNITDSEYDKKRGYYGTVGENTVIKHSRIIKDVKIGDCAYIKGANKLKNLTILSSKLEPSQIGEGVELVNGIVGYGSKIFYGCKAVRFVTGRNTQIKYGARLINSVLGDNSTISCCELLSNLIFPFHEQHHNTSFLIAATVMGQSNIAAGATIGSNHNSRAADGEIVAGRGFWPGLSSDYKHNCCFSSFVLVSKGSYSYEMNIKYPFSLVFQNKKEEAIQIIPGYWFIYNMYALERNNYKFKNRDKRKIKVQNIELDYLAPDTINEILSSIERIEYLIGVSQSHREDLSYKDNIQYGRDYIKNNGESESDIVIYDYDSMKRYGARILKPVKAVGIYKRMVLYYIVKTFFEYFNLADTYVSNILKELVQIKQATLNTEWKNIGGQLIAEDDLKNLFDKIKSGKINKWSEIHDEYNRLWDKYPLDKCRHAIFVLEKMYDKNIEDIGVKEFVSLFVDGISVKDYIYKTAYNTRAKDYTDKFRKTTFDNQKEMVSVIGELEDNDFLIELKEISKKFVDTITKFINS